MIPESLGIRKSPIKQEIFHAAFILDERRKRNNREKENTIGGCQLDRRKGCLLHQDF